MADETTSQKSWLADLLKQNKSGLLQTAGAIAAAEAAPRLTQNKLAHSAILAATSGNLVYQSAKGAVDSHKDGEMADMMMHGLNATLGTYGIVARDKEAIETSALMKLLFDLSHEAQDSINTRFAKMRKGLAKKFAGLPMLAHVHSEGDGHHHHGDHDHPGVYGDKEVIDEETGLTLTHEEQEHMEGLLDHWRQFGAARVEEAFKEYEKLQNNEDRTAYDIAKFQHSYGFIVVKGLQDKKGEPIKYDFHKQPFPQLDSKEAKDAPPEEKDFDNKTAVKMPDWKIIKDARNYDDFKKTFRCLYYSVKQAKREYTYKDDKLQDKPLKGKNGTVFQSDDYQEIFAREIQPGDLVEVKPGQGIPVDGTITKAVKGALINTHHYSGDPGDTRALDGDPIYQLGKVSKDSAQSITMEATQKYKTSSGFEMLNGISAGKGASKQIWLKKKIEQYMKLMMAAGSIMFLKDAIKNSKEGMHFDFETLTSKKNIQNTFEFFISAAPCPLAASMLVYKGVEEQLKAMGDKNGQGTLIQSREQLINAKDTEVVVFDLVGTLTKGRPMINEDDIIVGHGNKDMLLAVAGKLEAGKAHPVAHAIREAAAKFTTEHCETLDKQGVPEELAAQRNGITAKIDGRISVVGNLDYFKTIRNEHSKYMSWLTDDLIKAMEAKASQYIADGGDTLRDAVIVMHEDKRNKPEWAVIGYQDEVRPNAKSTLQALLKEGKEVVIATGSTRVKGEALLKQMNLDDAYKDKVKLRASLQPGTARDKKMETKTSVINEYLAKDKKVMMVGDGINDAQAMQLAAKNGGVAVGIQSLDTGVVQHAAGVMITDIGQTHGLIKLSEKLDKTVRTNVGLSAGWMGFLVTIHLMGEKLKQWFGIEIGALAKGFLHEGATVAIALKGGVLDTNRLAEYYVAQSLKPETTPARG